MVLARSAPARLVSNSCRPSSSITGLMVLMLLARRVRVCTAVSPVRAKLGPVASMVRVTWLTCSM